MSLKTFITRRWSAIPGGAGTNSVALSLKKHSDNTEIDSANTAGSGASAGLATLESDYFGPHYISGTNAGTTLNSTSKQVGFVGTVSGYDIDLIGMASNDGVIDGVLNEAAVTAAGTDMEVDIATGGFLLRGHPYRNTASAAVVIGANGTANPRIDRVIIRHHPKGTAEEGHAELAVLEGTAAASPSAPAVTQDATVWEVALAQVAVAAGATSISNANLTDERPFVGPRSAGAVIEALLALKAPLASPTFTGTVVLPAVTAGGTITANSVAITPTELGYIGTLTSDAQTQISAKANSASPTLSNPTFTGTVTVPDGALAQADVSGLVAALAAKLAASGPSSTGNGVHASTGDPAYAFQTAGGLVYFTINGLYEEINLANGGELVFYSGNPGTGQTLRIAGATGSIIANGATITPTELSTLDGIGATAIVTLLAAKAPLASPTLTGTTTVARLKTSGSAPSVVLEGGGTVNSVEGNDTVFHVTFTTDASPPAGNIMTITFNSARPDANYGVWIQQADTDAGDIGQVIYGKGSQTTGGFLVNARGTVGASTQYILSFLVIGNDA